MNLKKLLISVITIVMLGMIALQSNVYAKVQGLEVKIGATEYMDYNAPDEAYSIDDRKQIIYNIVKYPETTALNYDDNSNLYCLRAGAGMHSNDKNTQRYAIYNVYYDMKTERDKITTENPNNDILEELVDGNVDNISKYNSILAILDMLYLPDEATELDRKELIYTILKEIASDEEEMKIFSPYVGGMTRAFEIPENTNAEDFLNAILQNKVALKDLTLTNFALTNNDIKAIQQSVLWYFTNNDNNVYNKLTSGISWIYYKNEGASSYLPLTNYKPNNLSEQNDAGTARAAQAHALYRYMIKKAKENANHYDEINSIKNVPIEIETETLSYIESGENYNIGPIKMKQINSNKYTIDFVVKNNGQEITDYTLLELDENQRPVTSEKTVKDLVGEDFYISVPKKNVESLTIDITVNYSYNDMKLWISTTNSNEQPIAEVTPKKDTYSKQLSLKVTPEPEEKPFDLALRKYITKVERGNEVISIPNGNRVPNIDESSLQTGTTATYRHRKDPVVIKTGDIITYKITIYNEGQKAGRATQVIDQLPTGLKYVSIADNGNFEVESYNETTNNQLVLKRKTGNITNLPAYTKGNLVGNGVGSETIEIKCRVTEKPDTQNEKILTNVAWISEAIDEEGNEIENERDDIDSLPRIYPDVDKDNMSDYRGNGNKPDLADSNYYYKGQEDDDDFEKLKLLPEVFDLKLVKYISAVNGDTSKGKNEPKIDTTKLASGEETTANYDLDKTAVNVKVGDYVTYTFRVYNEGDIDGYVTKLTDNIPLGLQFVQLARTRRWKNDYNL
ncbi:MAG: DUF11 domain-containing protein [Clostridia bacterium]|nr:DUF11 domain-containing protein [Clostridia bacterium]